MHGSKQLVLWENNLNTAEYDDYNSFYLNIADYEILSYFILC